MSKNRIAIVVKGSGFDPFTEHYRTTSSAAAPYTDDETLFITALEQAGLQVTPCPWDDSEIEWNDFDLILIRSPWGFFFEREKFRRWLDHIDSLAIPILNPSEVVRWNISKRYLKDLENKGISIIPTEVFERNSEFDLKALLEETAWEEFVIKPASLGGAYGAERGVRSDIQKLAAKCDEILQDDELIVQEFFPEISVGEWSMVFFDAEFSHSVRKVPAAGEWREQAQFGGDIVIEKASTAICEQAKRALKALDMPTLYARVDGFERDGTLFVNELELIDPRLFFAADPLAASRLVDCVKKRL